MGLISHYVHIFCQNSKGDYTQVRFIKSYCGLLPATHTHLFFFFFKSDMTLLASQAAFTMGSPIHLIYQYKTKLAM